ncbi:unnamed protein product, partial [Allacma fusca]
PFNFVVTSLDSGGFDLHWIDNMLYKNKRLGQEYAKSRVAAKGAYRGVAENEASTSKEITSMTVELLATGNLLAATIFLIELITLIWSRYKVRQNVLFKPRASVTSMLPLVSSRLDSKN